MFNDQNREPFKPALTIANTTSVLPQLHKSYRKNHCLRHRQLLNYSIAVRPSVGRAAAVRRPDNLFARRRLKIVRCRVAVQLRTFTCTGINTQAIAYLFTWPRLPAALIEQLPQRAVMTQSTQLYNSYEQAHTAYTRTAQNHGSMFLQARS